MKASSGAVLILAAWLLGCQGPSYDFADLPPDPLAIVYRTMSQSDRAYDQVLKSEEFVRKRRGGRPTRRRQWDRNRVKGEDLLAAFTSKEERALASLGQLALVDPRTGEVEPVPWAKRGSRPLGWSADRTRLLYLSLRTGDPHVFERNTITGENHQLTYDNRRYLGATYCGSTGLVTASVDRGGQIQLHYREAQGGVPVPITEGSIAHAPECSADGKTVFFEGLDPKGRRVIGSLQLADPKGTLRVLTVGRHPAVTPDGKWVVYSAKIRDVWKLWRMRPDGSGRHPFGRGADWEHAPTISPDGRYVAFTATVSERPVRQRLWVRPLNGEADRPLRVDGDALEPAW